MSITSLYDALYAAYGARGWWPIIDVKSGLSRYGSKKRLTDDKRFEIILGTILTQNVAWKNAARALHELKRRGLVSPARLGAMATEEIAPLIRPAGYFNQKAATISRFTEWLLAKGGSFAPLKRIRDMELRDQLLGIRGIGPETADSMLLYAMERPFFVIDAYTRRILVRLGICHEKVTYTELQELFHKALTGAEIPVILYNEYHALMVEHAKTSCQKKPLCPGCVLLTCCPWGVSG